MKLSELHEDKQRRILVKFAEGPNHDFTRMVGYCYELQDMLDLWLSQDKKRIVGPFGDVNLYQIMWSKKIRPTRWDMFTPGYTNVPHNKIPPQHLTQIFRANDKNEARRIHKDLGYTGFEGGFDVDMIKNTRSHKSQQGEVIINKPALFRYLASPDENGDHDVNEVLSNIER